MSEQHQGSVHMLSGLALCRCAEPLDSWWCSALQVLGCWGNGVPVM